MGTETWRGVHDHNRCSKKHLNKEKCSREFETGEGGKDVGLKLFKTVQLDGEYMVDLGCFLACLEVWELVTVLRTEGTR